MSTSSLVLGKMSRVPALDWSQEVEKRCRTFAAKHSVLLRSTERQLSAAFEVGCFHAVLQFYESQRYSIHPEGLVAGAYRYLTTPSGNPENFSYVRLVGSDGEFELRQQVRIESHVDPEIRFTPDLVVLVKDCSIVGDRREDFASGRRPFFRVSSRDVIAAHECKSTNPFPELLVAFIGMLVAAHEWYPDGASVKLTKGYGHLAPTLFVGGSARALHMKMIRAMENSYKMNVVCGLHEGTWKLRDVDNRIVWRRAVPATPLANVGDDEIPF